MDLLVHHIGSHSIVYIICQINYFQMAKVNHHIQFYYIQLNEFHTSLFMPLRFLGPTRTWQALGLTDEMSFAIIDRVPDQSYFSRNFYVELTQFIIEACVSDLEKDNKFRFRTCLQTST